MILDTALSRLQTRLPIHGQTGMPTDWTFRSLLESLLERVPLEGRADVVRQVLREEMPLSARLTIINTFGSGGEDSQSGESQGDGLLGLEETTQFRDDVRNRVIDASAEDLAAEPRLPQLLLGMVPGDADANRQLAQEKTLEDSVMRSLVVQSLRRVGAANDAGSWSQWILDWNALQALLGDDYLVARTIELADRISADDPAERAAWDQAVKYANGSEPPRLP